MISNRKGWEGTAQSPLLCQDTKDIQTRPKERLLPALQLTPTPAAAQPHSELLLLSILTWMVAGPAAATTSLPTASGTELAQATSFRATSTVTQPPGAVAPPWCGGRLPGWLPAGPTGDMPHAWLLRGAQEQQHEAGARHNQRHLPTRLAADPTPVPRSEPPERELPSHVELDPTLQLWRIPPPVVPDTLQAMQG